MAKDTDPFETRRIWDANHVFHPWDTMAGTAPLRNYDRELRHKKKVISQQNAYHVGTYLTASLSSEPARRGILR